MFGLCPPCHLRGRRPHQSFSSRRVFPIAQILGSSLAIVPLRTAPHAIQGHVAILEFSINLASTARQFVCNRVCSRKICQSLGPSNFAYGKGVGKTSFFEDLGCRRATRLGEIKIAPRNEEIVQKALNMCTYTFSKCVRNFSNVTRNPYTFSYTFSRVGRGAYTFSPPGNVYVHIFAAERPEEWTLPFPSFDFAM